MRLWYRRNMSASFIAFAVVAVNVVAAPVFAADPWSTPLAASSATDPATMPTVVTSANGARVLSVWRVNTGLTNRIASRLSSNGGVTWSETEFLTPANQDVDEFAFTLSSNGNVAAVLYDMNSGGDMLQVISSRDGGATWRSPTQLSPAGEGSNKLNLAISAEGNAIIAAWGNSATGFASVSMSRDGGSSWDGTATTLSGTGQNIDRVALSASSDAQHIFVGWVNYTANPDSIQVARTSDSGISWVKPGASDRISSNAADGFDRLLLATGATGNNVVAMWNSSGNAVSANRSSDFGATWLTGADVLNLAASASPEDLDISADGTKAMALLQQTIGGNSVPVVRVSTNGGTTWGAAVNAGPAGVASTALDIKTSTGGSVAAVLWRRNSEAGVSRTSDGGVTWSSSGNLDATGLNVGGGSLGGSADLSWLTATWLQTFGSIDRVWTSRTGTSPVPTSISPSSGTTAGGTAVTITGSGFVAGATVTIGGAAATDVSVTSSTTVTAKTPVAAAGKVSVTITNVDGQSSTLSDAYTFVTPEKAAQEPTKPLKFVAKIKPGKWTKVLATPVTTNAGLSAPVKATAKAGKKKAAKKDFKTKSKKGYFQVWSSGKKKLTVTVTVNAPTTDTYAAFSVSKKYTVKKS